MWPTPRRQSPNTLCSGALSPEYTSAAQPGGQSAHRWPRHSRPKPHPHERFARRKLLAVDVGLHRRVAVIESVLGRQALEYPLGRMPLLRWSCGQLCYSPARCAVSRQSSRRYWPARHVRGGPDASVSFEVRRGCLTYAFTPASQGYLLARGPAIDRCGKAKRTKAATNVTAGSVPVLARR